MHYPDVVLAGIAIFLFGYILFPGEKWERAFVAISMTAMYLIVVFITIGLSLKFFS